MLTAIVSSFCLPTALYGQSVDRHQLIRQLEASDAIARLLERPGDHSRASTKPSSAEAKPPLAYDQLLREAIRELPADISGAPDLGVLNEYQIRQAIALLQLNNIQAYVALTHRNDSAAARENLQSAIHAAATQPARSSILMRYLHDEPEAEVFTAQQMHAAAGTGDGLGESKQPSRSGDSAAVAVLSGNSSPQAFDVASTVTPLDAKMRGSQVVEAVLPRTLPLPGDARRALPLRADAPGNPSDVIPSP